MIRIDDVFPIAFLIFLPYCGTVYIYYHLVPVLSDQPHRTSLVAETSTIEIHRDDSEEELGMRIVGGRDTPLGNIVVQEVLKDSLIATDGKIMPGDHILEVSGLHKYIDYI